jgi:hypothetical protein
MALARVTGAVLTTSEIKGKGRQSGEPYRMQFARVLVENRDITEVRIPDTIKTPIDGQLVDYLCELGTYGGRLSVDVKDEYPTAA